MTKATREPSYKSVMAMKQSRPVIQQNIDTRRGYVRVTLTNKGDTLSTYNQLQLLDNSGNGVWPQTWSDNFITLQPNETRVITVKVPPSRLKSSLRVKLKH